MMTVGMAALHSGQADF